jgi:hypothetical protein
VVAAAALAAIEADLRQRGRDARRIAGATFRIALELLSGVEALPLPNVKEVRLLSNVTEVRPLANVREVRHPPNVVEVRPLPNVVEVRPLPNVVEVRPLPNVREVRLPPSVVEVRPLPNVKEGTLNRRAELREDRLRLMIIRLIKFLLLEIDYCNLFEVGW